MNANKIYIHLISILFNFIVYKSDLINIFLYCESQKGHSLFFNVYPQAFVLDEKYI